MLFVVQCSECPSHLQPPPWSIIQLTQRTTSVQFISQKSCFISIDMTTSAWTLSISGSLMEKLKCFLFLDLRVPAVPCQARSQQASQCGLQCSQLCWAPPHRALSRTQPPHDGWWKLLPGNKIYRIVFTLTIKLISPFVINTDFDFLIMTFWLQLSAVQYGRIPCERGDCDPLTTEAQCYERNRQGNFTILRDVWWVWLCGWYIQGSLYITRTICILDWGGECWCSR